MDVCLRLLKESSKSRFDSYSVRNRVLIISHITFRDCQVHLFSDNLFRNSCIMQVRRRNDRNFPIDTEILQILTHFSYLILASHRPCHDVELTQLWFSVVDQLFLNIYTQTQIYCSTAFLNVMMSNLSYCSSLPFRTDINQYCVNSQVPERDRSHLAKIMYHVRNCTKLQL